MSRLPSLRRDELGADGQQVWDSVVGTRGTRVRDADGGLAGPFNAFLHAPGVGQRMASLGAAVRWETSLDRKLAELAIITVGARWKAEYEWWAHARLARENGVPEAVIEAIARGEDPALAGDERTVYRLASRLARTGHVAQDDYDAARALLGEAGLVELVALCGYYTLVSFVLNAFAVPLPPGAEPTWGGAGDAAPPPR